MKWYSSFTKCIISNHPFIHLDIMAPTSANLKSKKGAKDALIGVKSNADLISSSSFTAPERRPLGQEDSDDDDDGDDDDIDLDQDDMIAIARNRSNDDDDVMIADDTTSYDAKDAYKGEQNQKGKQKQTKISEEHDAMSLETNDKPIFKPLSASAAQSARDAIDVTRGQLRKVPIPPHRMTPLKNEWPKIYTPLVEMAKLQVRMNVKRKTVEIKVS